MSDEPALIKPTLIDARLQVLGELLPDGGEEYMKYAKYFSATLSPRGAFETVTAFLVTADEPPGMVCWPLEDEPRTGLLAGGTVERKDALVAGDLYREAAAAREAREEFGLDFAADVLAVREVWCRRARQVSRPHVSREVCP